MPASLCTRLHFADLAQDVKQVTKCAAEHDITIAVMADRVNVSGETNDADLGVWCEPTTPNPKRGTKELGAFSYDDPPSELRERLDKLIGA